MKPSHHTKTYVILGSLILLALLVLIATYFVNRKSESKMKITRLITTLIIFIILLSGCDSSGKDKKKDSAQTKEFRIVPTTVALTMTLDKLDLPIVGKPTSYKKLPERYKNVPEVGQPMEPSVEAVKK